MTILHIPYTTHATIRDAHTTIGSHQLQHLSDGNNSNHLVMWLDAQADHAKDYNCALREPLGLRTNLRWPRGSTLPHLVENYH